MKGHAPGGCVMRVREKLREMGWEEVERAGTLYLTRVFHGERVYIRCPRTIDDLAEHIHRAARRVVELGGGR